MNRVTTPLRAMSRRRVPRRIRASSAVRDLTADGCSTDFTPAPLIERHGLGRLGLLID
jgi:hypothetical protein